MTMHPPIHRKVCHICGLSWAVRGGKFTNHNRWLRGQSVRCGGSRTEPEEPNHVAAAFAPAPVAPEEAREP